MIISKRRWKSFSQIYVRIKIKWNELYLRLSILSRSLMIFTNVHYCNREEGSSTKTAPIVTPWDLQFQKVVSDHLPSHHDITWGGHCQKVAQYCISDEGINQLASSVVRLVIRGHTFFIFHRSTLWKTWYLVRITSSPLLLLGPLMKTTFHNGADLSKSNQLFFVSLCTISIHSSADDIVTIF